LWRGMFFLRQRDDIFSGLFECGQLAPIGSEIGSSNWRLQSLMPPALLVELRCQAGWHAGRGSIVGWATVEARRAPRAASAGVWSVPRLLGMAFTHPTTVIA
jgi:hypothetical protein